MPWLDWRRRGPDRRRPASASGGGAARRFWLCATCPTRGWPRPWPPPDCSRRQEKRSRPPATCACGPPKPRPAPSSPRISGTSLCRYRTRSSWAGPRLENGGFEAVLRRRGAGAVRSAAGARGWPGPALPLHQQPAPGAVRPPDRAGAARLPERAAARVHGALVLPAARCPAAHPQRQGGPAALPAPDVARPETGEALVAPRNPTEARLAEIWSELLGIERIGVDDDFFELGGHSLLATQAVSRVRESFGVELPLRTFFEAPTVAAVAGEVENLRLGGAEAAPAIVPVPRTGRLPLSFAQERLWFLDRLDTRTLAYNESSAFRLEGRLDGRPCAGAWTSCCGATRACAPPSRRWTARPCRRSSRRRPSRSCRSICASCLWRSAKRRPRNRRSPRLSDPSTWRGVRWCAGCWCAWRSEEHAVLFTSHHIVFDGWSTGIFVGELSALYAARIAGQPSPLPPLADPVCRLRRLAAAWLAGRGPGEAARLLAGAADRARRARPADRPAAARPARAPRRPAPSRSSRPVDGEAAGTQPRPGSDARS